MKVSKYAMLMIALIITLVCTTVVSAYSTMVISIAETTAYAGETVIVPVTLSDNTGFVSASFYIEYDDSILTLLGVNEKSLINGAAHTTQFTSPYILSWENDLRTSNYTVNGTLVELVFTVSSFADPGDYNIRISTPTHGILNNDGVDVDCSFSMGTITVISEDCSHEWNNWAKASRTRHKRSCDLCGEVEYDSHSWDDGEVTKEPTVDSSGITTYTCSICSATKAEAIPPLPTPTIPGDISGDGVLDYFDVTALYAAYQSGEVDAEIMDVNHDGVVDYYDVSKLYAAFRGTATLT